MKVVLLDDAVFSGGRVRIWIAEFIEIADDLRDAVTADMLTARMQFHEKAVWMLRSMIAE
jgi:DNA-binding ferritin-like protein